MMTQKGALYIQMFSTLAGVRLVSWILSWLNILSISPAKQCDTKLSIHRLRWFTAFRPLTYFSAAVQPTGYHRSTEWSIHENVQYFIISKTVVLNFVTIDILCTSAVRDNALKITIHRSLVTCFSAKQKKLPAINSDISLVMLCVSQKSSPPKTFCDIFTCGEPV